MNERTRENVGMGGHGRGLSWLQGVGVGLPSDHGDEVRTAGRYYQQCQLRPSRALTLGRWAWPVSPGGCTLPVLGHQILLLSFLP